MPAVEAVLAARPRLRLLVTVLLLVVLGGVLLSSAALAAQTDPNHPNPYAAASSTYRDYNASNADGGWIEPQLVRSSSSSSVLQYTSVSKVSRTTWSSLWQRLIGYFKRDITPSENGTTNSQSTSTQSQGASAL